MLDGRAAGLCVMALGACVLPRPIERERREAPAAEVGDVAAVWRPAGRSVEGRPLEICEVGHGPRRVVWIGGIHGDEREGRVATERLRDAVAADADLGARVTLTLVRDLNPDGSARARRHNARGVDLNRNFPAATFRGRATNGRAALDQPESRFLHDLLRALAPDLVVVCHSTAKGPFVNWDGPAEQLAQRFAALSGCPVVPSGELHATPGSLGSWAGVDLAVPVLTVEYRRGSDPETAWQQTRDAILAVVAADA